MIRSLHRQRGISLISLMIGLLVSLLAVMGMMALYRTVMHTTTESGAYAQLAGDRSAALLVAHTYLQGAGFGVEDATLGDHLLLCSPSMNDGRLGVGGGRSGDGGLLANLGFGHLWRQFGQQLQLPRFGQSVNSTGRVGSGATGGGGAGGV